VSTTIELTLSTVVIPLTTRSVGL